MGGREASSPRPFSGSERAPRSPGGCQADSGRQSVCGEDCSAGRSGQPRGLPVPPPLRGAVPYFWLTVWRVTQVQPIRELHPFGLGRGNCSWANHSPHWSQVTGGPDPGSREA